MMSLLICALVTVGGPMIWLLARTEAAVRERTAQAKATYDLALRQRDDEARRRVAAMRAHYSTFGVHHSHGHQHGHGNASLQGGCAD